MTEQLRDQISAFVDSELPGKESELLVRRLGREDDAHDVAKRYLLIGRALRGEPVSGPAADFHQRVMQAVDELDETVPAQSPAWSQPPRRWRRAAGGLGAAAAVAVAAVFGLEMMNQSPGGGASPEQGAAYTVTPVVDREAEAVPDLRSGMPPVRLTNYMLSHGEYAGTLGRKTIQSGMIGTSAAQAMGGYFERETREGDE